LLNYLKNPLAFFTADSHMSEALLREVGLLKRGVEELIREFRRVDDALKAKIVQYHQNETTIEQLQQKVEREGTQYGSVLSALTTADEK